jgi:hypothetical protein
MTGDGIYVDEGGGMRALAKRCMHTQVKETWGNKIAAQNRGQVIALHENRRKLPLRGTT